MKSETEFDNDFGFTAVDASSMDVVVSTSEKLDELYEAIQPLLENLKKKPEKDHIYWPDRLKKVNAFSEKLKKIYEK